MIDFTKEKPLPLRKAAALVPGASGQGGIHISTIHRWVTRGHEGIRLEAVRIGGRWMTSAEAMGRFVEAVTEAHVGPRALSPRADPRQAELISAALDAAGF